MQGFGINGLIGPFKLYNAMILPVFMFFNFSHLSIIQSHFPFHLPQSEIYEEDGGETRRDQGSLKINAQKGKRFLILF